VDWQAGIDRSHNVTARCPRKLAPSSASLIEVIVSDRLWIHTDTDGLFKRHSSAIVCVRSAHISAPRDTTFAAAPWSFLSSQLAAGKQLSCVAPQ